MAYITRELERKFLKLNDFFKVILVTGARQVGKTTMLKHLAESSRTYVTMDNTMARALAQSDPVLFFQTYKPPILIDEVQKAPELFEQIKIICDESDEKGLIWLTGSQQYNMMKKVRETLAGRIGILELYSLSAREKAGLVFDTDLDFSLATLQARQQKVPKNDVIQVFQHIWEGGMPQVQGVDDELRQEYFNSYIDTYLMRDATEAGGITDAVRFRKFLVGCASLVSEQVNYSTLAESADIAPSTAKEWLNVLVGLRIIYLLASYSNNELKRLSKTPKLYFCDTGLCAYLTRWLTKDSLRDGAAEVYKYGAAPSYVKRGARVRRITGSCLPAGLQSADTRPETTGFTLEKGSFFVMLSDGVADVNDDGWLMALLEKFQGDDPQALASAILAAGRERRGGDDDCAVLALYRDKDGGAVEV